MPAFIKESIGLLALLSGLGILAQAPEHQEDAWSYFPGGPWMVKVYFPDVGVIQDVAQWHEPRMIDFEVGSFLIDVDEAGLEKLDKLGCHVELDESGTKALWSHKLQSFAKGGGGIPGFPCYLTVEETYALGESWAVDFPDLVEWIDIGDSWEKTQNAAMGDDMMVAKLTNRNIAGPKPAVFIMSAVHAREYTTAALNTDFGQMLLDGYNQDADITWLLDEHEIHLLLQANPDGRKRAETGLSWRKNTNNDFCSNTDFRGIDLNRNFPFQWGCCGGSSTDECSNVYRGPSGASEPEIQAITNYVRSIFPDQRGPNLSDPAPPDASGIFMDIHSFSELVIWPYGFDNTPTPNGPALRTLGRKLAFFNQYFPDSAASLFSADGTTDDFAYGELGVASFAFELGTQFFQPCSDYNQSIKPDNLASLLYMCKVARTPYLTPSGPEVISLTADQTSVFQGQSVRLQARFDDTRFNQSNGAEPTGNIAAAEVYINTPPWRGGVGQAMQPVDGSFDTGVDDGEFTLDTTGLDAGRYLLYVRGQDDAGNWGSFSAVFLFVFDPSSAAAISGTLTNDPSGIPLGGVVQAGLFNGASDAGNGQFQFPVVPGDYSVVATAADHASGQQMATVGASQNVSVPFSLPRFCAEFQDDAEMGNLGWTADGSWAISTDDAFGGAASWTDSPGGNYTNNQNASLTSPVVDLTGYNQVQVRFQTRYAIPDLDDRVAVEYSTNGNTWTLIESFTGTMSDWQKMTLSVPALDDELTVQIRFRFQTDFFTSGDGFYMDDFAILGIGPSCDSQSFVFFLPQWPQPASILHLMRFLLP